MPLTSGTRVGPYEIAGWLGAGGMGEVYRARDGRLARDVAIKLISDKIATDPSRVRRFEQEARAAGQINHPNILAVYDIGTHAGTPYIVSELLEGESLASRRQAGALPSRKAIDYARQTAEGLAAAHDKGIVHRDLKPDNLFLTNDGRIKILDFGIAKLTLSSDDQARATGFPTETAAGMVVGTAGYMSPEQVRGETVDARSDLFSLGAVLYEMLAGRAAFIRATAAETMAAILKEDPPRPLGTDVSPALERIVSRCLEKTRETRFQSARDLAFALETVSGTTATAAAATAVSRPRHWRTALGAIVVVLSLLTAVASWLSRDTTPAAPARDVQFQRLTDFVGMEESPAISPDGKAVAFVARGGRKRQIWQRYLAGGAPLQITRDDVDHEQPRWTSDSSSLIYYVPSATPGEHGTIWEIPALGGAPRRVASALGGGDISHDGRRIALFRFDDKGMALVLVTRDGSGADQVNPVPPSTSYEYPRWSPDDHWVAFQRNDPGTGFIKRVMVVSAIPGGDAREIARGADLKGLSWLPGGSGVVYSSSSGSTVLYPPLFNLRAVERDGTGDRQLTFGDVSYTEPDVHTSGTLTASRLRMQSDIWKFPVNGSPAENTHGGVQITHQTGQAQTPSVSPDELEVVYLSDSGGHGNLWIARTDGSSVPRQITFERDPALSVGVPVWSPVGNQIVFILSRPGETGLSVINRDGSGLRQFVPVGFGAAWSADGRWVYYTRNTGDRLCIEKAAIEGGPAISVRCDSAYAPGPTADGSALYSVNRLIKTNGIMDHEIRRARPENDPSAEVLHRVSGSRVPVDRSLFYPVLSPDGKWLAIALSDGTTSNIWALPTGGGPMRPFTDFGERSIVIGRRVSWSSNSKYLYAAVAETDADILLLNGLLTSSGSTAR